MDIEDMFFVTMEKTFEKILKWAQTDAKSFFVDKSSKSIDQLDQIKCAIDECLINYFPIRMNNDIYDEEHTTLEMFRMFVICYYLINKYSIGNNFNSRLKYRRHSLDLYRKKTIIHKRTKSF